MKNQESYKYNILCNDSIIFENLTEEEYFDKLEDLAQEYSQQSANVKVDNQPPGTYGGYTSMAEWAENDPKGYKAQNKASKGITIGYVPK